MNPGREDLAGKVQDTVTGQVQYFSGELELVQVLRCMIKKEADGAGGTAIEREQQPLCDDRGPSKANALYT